MDIKDFLKSRNIAEDVIQRMEEEKLDADTICLLSDTELSLYLPRKGDRVALKHFLHHGESKHSAENVTKSRKDKLFDALREKLDPKKASADTNNDTIRPPSKHLFGNKNAGRSSRKIEIGWMHRSSKDEPYAQIRTKRGGGTRTAVMDKAAHRGVIKEKGAQLFFPEGENSFGKLEGMDVEICDFKGKPIDGNSTLGWMYEVTKLPIIRVYFATTGKREKDDLKLPSDHSDDSLPDVLNNSKSKIDPGVTVSTPDQAESATQASAPAGDRRQDKDKHLRKKPRPDVVNEVAANVACGDSSPAPLDITFFPDGKDAWRNYNDTFGEVMLGPVASDKPPENILADDSSQPPTASEDRLCDEPLPGTSTSIHQRTNNVESTDEIPSPGRAYIDIWPSVDEDDDIEIISPMEVKESDESILLQDVLAELAVPINDDVTSKFNVWRGDVWEGAVRGFSRKSFTPANKMDVVFTDDEGTREGSVDMGGPMREFFTELMDTLPNKPIFIGDPMSKFLTNDISMAERDAYFLAGRAIAMSLVHGGTGPNFFSSSLYNALVHGIERTKICLEELPQCALKESIEKVLSKTVVASDFTDAVDQEPVLMANMEAGGTWVMIKSMEDCRQALNNTAHWYLLGRTAANFERLKEGLKTLGVLEAVRQHPGLFKEVFCAGTNRLTAEQVKGIFAPQYSRRGTAKRSLEAKLLSYWNDFLQDTEEGEIAEGEIDITLEGILQFATGSKFPPPRGWRTLPKIHFLHEPEKDGKKSMFPKANTCGLTLHIPTVHSSYDKFKEYMFWGISNAKGFGYA